MQAELEDCPAFCLASKKPRKYLIEKFDVGLATVLQFLYEGVSPEKCGSLTFENVRCRDLEGKMLEKLIFILSLTGFTLFPQWSLINKKNWIYLRKVFTMYHQVILYIVVFLSVIWWAFFLSVICWGLVEAHLSIDRPAPPTEEWIAPNPDIEDPLRRIVVNSPL